MSVRAHSTHFNWVQPLVWVCIFLLLPLQRSIVTNSVTGATWNFYHLGFGAALLWLYYSHWRRQELRARQLWPPVSVSLVLLFAFLAGRHGFVSAQTTGLLLLITWGTMPLYYFLHYNRAIAIYVLVVSLTIHSLWGIAQFSLQSDLNLDFLGETPIELGQPGIATFRTLAGEKLVRGYGPYPHPNVLAGSIVLGLIIFLHRYHQRRQISRVPDAVMRYFLALALLLTFSRTAWAAAALLYAVSRLTKTEVVRVIPVLITIIICAPLLLARVPAGDEAALIERRNGLADARVLIQQSPLWHGVGPGNYQDALAEHLNRQHIAYESWQIAPVHNIPLLLVAELGVLPALFLISLLIFVWGPRFQTTWLFIVPVVPLVLFDHYLLTQTAPLVYLVMVLLALAAQPPVSATALNGITFRKHASAGRPAIK